MVEPSLAFGLRVQVLGAFRVQVGDRLVPEGAWRLRRAQHVLKLLALAPGHGLHRDQLLDYLWPEADPMAATTSLRQAIAAARRALEAAAGGHFPALHMVGDRLTLRPPGALWVDVDAFEAAAAAARRGGEPAAYQAALTLYTGDLLPEDRYADWAASRRETLQQTRLALLLELAWRHHARGALTDAVAALERLVTLEPSHEEAQVGLMRLYVQLGQRERALRQYGRLQAALQELDAEPDPATREFAQQMATGIGTAPTAVESATPPNNLPAALTSLIGRATDQAAVARMFATTRLVTLTGAGGIGKTRLALATATAMLTSQDWDGVWLVDLSPLADPALVPATVGLVLGVYAGPVDDLVERLVAVLRRRTVLLILDNCEHVLDACAALLTDLLRDCPRLRVLATSRLALRVAGEVAWRVSSLALAAPGEGDLTRLAASPAVQLFIERARLVEPAFTLTPATAPLVATICQRLDGMPLAIELAAPWVRVLSLSELAARLTGSLVLLVDGSRGGAGRQRTLRATLDWSYQLLAEPEQRLLRRLAVFAGSFSLGAVEVVGTDEPALPTGLLLWLARLVDLSLVVANLDGGRFRLLETVRVDALERLRASDEEATIRQRHAAFYLGQARAARPIIWGLHPKRTWWLDELFRDLDNLRAARRWMETIGALDDLLWLAGALPPFFLHRCTFGEGLDWAERALALPGVDRSPSRAQAWLGQAHFARAAEDYDRALALTDASLAEFERLGDEHGRALALANIGAIYAWRGEAAARPILEEVVALCRRLDPSPGLGIPLQYLGSLALFSGEPAEARRLLAEAAAALEQAGDRFRWAHARLFGGLAALQLGDLAAARATFAETLAVTADSGDDWGLAIALEAFACLAAARGAAEVALQLAGAAEAVRLADSINVSIVGYRRLRDSLLQPAWQALTPPTAAAAIATGRAWDRVRAVAAAATVE